MGEADFRLGLTDLAPLVRKAHEAEMLVESTYEEFQRDLEYAIRILMLPVDRETNSTPLAVIRGNYRHGWDRDGQPAPVRFKVNTGNVTGVIVHGSVSCVFCACQVFKSSGPCDRLGGTIRSQKRMTTYTL